MTNDGVTTSSLPDLLRRERERRRSSTGILITIFIHSDCRRHPGTGFVAKVANLPPVGLEIDQFIIGSQQ